MKTTSGQLRSGKGSRDENFPVASWLIKPQHRPAILAFYEFVRVADDIADHASLTSDEKVDRLNGMEASLLGKSDHEPEGVRLRGVLEAQRLTRATRRICSTRSGKTPPSSDTRTGMI